MTLHAHLLELENELMGQETRHSSLLLTRLLADDFHEFSASGGIWRKQETIEALQGEVFVERSISTSVLTMLSADAALLTYTCSSPRYDSLRSSIWRRNAEGWQLFFHQGTPIEKSQ